MTQEKQRKILSLINDGIRPYKISKILNISPNALSNRLLRYQKKKLLIKKKGNYYLTELGVNSISRLPLKREFTFLGENCIRKHNVRVRLPLRDRVDNPQVFLGSKGIDFKAMGLKNVHAGSFSLENFIVELMPSSVIVIMPEFYMPSSTAISELAAKTWDNLRFILESVEARLGVKIKRPTKDFFLSEIVSRHVAFTNHPLAEGVKKELSGVWVIEYSELDGKPSLIIDFSNGVPELEAVNTKTALLDAEEIKKNLQPIISEMKSGEFSEHRDKTDCRLCHLELSKEVINLRNELERMVREKKQKRIDNFMEGVKLGEKMFINKHRGEDTEDNLKKEYYTLIKPYVKPLLK